MFTISKVAEMLKLSRQAIYNRKAELEEKGYYQVVDGKAHITANGVEYLKNKRVETIQSQDIYKDKDKEVADAVDDELLKKKAVEDSGYISLVVDIYKKQIEFYKEQVERLEKEKQNILNMFIEKDRAYNELVYSRALNPSPNEQKEEKAEEEKIKKKGFFNRLFS